MMKRFPTFLLVILLSIGVLTLESVFPIFDGHGIAMAQEKKKRGFFQRLFGRSQKKEVKKTPQKETVKRKKRSPQNRKKAITKALPKIEEANRIVVIGDSTAGAISSGLVEAYKRTPSVLIASKIQNDIAITSNGFYPWLDASGFNFIGDRVKAVVVSIGTHDLNSIREAGSEFVFNSKGWQRAYRRRLVDIGAQIQLLGKPVIWVLPPPVLNNERSEKMREVIALQRSTLAPLKFRLINVEEGFLSRKANYSAFGPNISGERVRLREDDGIGFTKSGARKLALYVQREIDAILDENFDESLSANSLGKQKDGVQQIILLTRPALLENQVLSGGNGRTRSFYKDEKARSFFVDGKALTPPHGRVDNFIWPSEEEKNKKDEQALLDHAPKKGSSVQ